ncbi:MAG: MFS transporter [Actinobacteria bacterium]|nr:MFS transporter [Actinomycetota bacterium]
MSLRLLRTPQLGRVLKAAGILGLLTVGDGFLYLELTARDSLATTYFPLLYVGTNFAYLLLAVPFGRLADRIGRTPVYIGGYVALAFSYVFAGGPLSGPAASVACLLLLGAYYAATDGVLAALAARISASSVRASGIATAQTVVAASRFVSSLVFGLMWTRLGRVEALVVMTACLVVAIPVAALLLRGVDRPHAPATASAAGL